MKVSIFDKRLISIFLKLTSGLFAVLSAVLIFIDIPDNVRIGFGIAVLLILAIAYKGIWYWAVRLNDISVKIEGSVVNIKVGDIFKQPGLKVISFNEYFDTQVDDQLIAHASLNGLFISHYLDVPVAALDRYIEEYQFDEGDIKSRNEVRQLGKSVRYKLGTICVFNDYILAALAKFDECNRACLTMPEYLEFLINFWDKVNRIYAQKSVSTTIFGSGITRIKGLLE